MNWLSNKVPVIKKNGQVRICIDFRNLNLATPNDEYIILVADMVVDVAAKNRILIFMDGYSGCNQIYLAKKDIHKTVFHCPGASGIFEWVVIPFRSKNARIAYQRIMNLIFHGLISKNMEVYIDDVVIKLADFK